MEKWKLSRLSINNFKIFEKFDENFEFDLVVFDGPNGFGKTTIFDALQLLFCGAIPRIKALAKAINIASNRQYEKNLYRHNKSSGDVAIKAEFKRGDEVIILMRRASKIELDNKKNHKPREFSIFKLFLLESFNTSVDEGEFIVDEDSYLKSVFGEYFLNNYSILNYMSQENNPIIVPDESIDNKSRFEQISHLIKLDEIEEKIFRNKELLTSTKAKSKELSTIYSGYQKDIDILKQRIGEELPSTQYKRLGLTKLIEQWDKKKPIVSASYADFNSLMNKLALLENIVINIREVDLRLKNELISNFVKKIHFVDAIRIGPYLDRHNDLVEKNTAIKAFEKQRETLALGELDIRLEHLTFLQDLESDKIEELREKIVKRDSLVKGIDGSVKKITEIDLIRKSLMEKLSELKEQSHECPLCGFDYNQNVLLLEAIELRSESIRLFIDQKNSEFRICIKQLGELKKSCMASILSKQKTTESSFNLALFKDLEENKNKIEAIQSIVDRLKYHNINFEDDYAEDNATQQARFDNIKMKVLSLRKNESDVLLDGAITLFVNNFNNVEGVEKVLISDVLAKKSYIQFHYYQFINNELESTLKKQHKCKDEKFVVDELVADLDKISGIATKTKNEYSSETLGQIESLFHIYSGRLIQNYQSGLGMFIDTAEKKVGNKNKSLSFFTADGTSYDAVLSISSGQVAALTLAFFLSLNRKYANTSFVLIDDPTQSMDEINIASLSDLLRVELKDRQVIISTHEQEVADYLRYRHMRAGLKSKSIHMQNLALN